MLNGIDLSIAPGERIVVIGPSGTGKSTLLRCLNFLDRPEAGTIRLGDLTVDAARASKAQILALRRRTAFVFQNYALFANKTARENITEALVTVQKKPRAEAEARAATILSEIGLSEKADSYPAALSGLQQPADVVDALGHDDAELAQMSLDGIGDLRELADRELAGLVVAAPAFPRSSPERSASMAGSSPRRARPRRPGPSCRAGHTV